MTRLSVLCALSALNSFSASAQSGVLVGASTASSGGYHTLWIVRDTTRPLQATIPDLLVPRADGWWRVGTAFICETGGSERRSMEVLWRARADSAVTIPEICHELRRGDLPIPVYAEDSTEIDSIKQQIVRCSWSDVEIKFVSPEYMAIGEVSGQSEECEPRGGRWFQSYYVSHFNGDSSFALSQFAVAKVDSVARLALERAAKDLWRGGMCATVSEGINPDQLLEIGNAWYPWRISGRWMPIVWEPLEGPECTLHPGVDLVLTTTFTGDDSLRVPWSALARRIRGIEDAFTSPGGDLIVVRTADSLFVHLGDRQQLGRRIGSIPFAKHEIVMIQWATGRNVERWGHEIAAMTRRGFPGPKVVPAPKDP